MAGVRPMVILLIGMLIGAAVISLAVVGSSRVTAVLTGGMVLLSLAFFLVATAPPSQSLRLILSVQVLPDPPPAAPVLWMLVLLAALGGGALGWTLKAFEPPAEPVLSGPPSDPLEASRVAAARARTVLEVRLLVACLILAACGAAFGQISMIRALLAGLFAGGAIIAALEMRDVLRESQLELRSSWGGLGGGLGGWEVSRSAVLLLMALAFAGAALVAAGVPSPAFDSKKSAADEEKTKPGGEKSPGQPAGKTDGTKTPTGGS